MQDFQELTNGANAYRPWRDSVDDYDYCVRGTGDADDDHDLLTDAVTALNAAGKGTLVIEGTVRVKSTHDFSNPISIRGRNSGAKLLVTNTTDSFMAFRWNWSWAPTGATYYTVSTAKAFSETITSTSYAPTKGSWVVVWSEDLISDVLWHNAVYEPRPAELHHVSFFDQTNDLVYVSNGFVVDRLQTTGRMCVVPMQRGVTIRDIEVSHTGNSGEYATLFYMKCLDGLVIENVRSDRYLPGCFWLTFCSNIRMQGLSILGAERNENVYGIVAGVVNGMQICDSEIYGTRHPFTTTAGWTATGPYRRYGTPLNVVLDNVTATAYTKRDTDQGWIRVVAGSGTQPSVGNAVTGATSSASGTIVSITAGGSWAGGTGTATMQLGTITGQFLATEVLNFPSATTATAYPLSRNSLSTHPEGYGIKFHNCTVNVAGDYTNSAIYGRSRAEEYVNCTVRGVGTATNWASGIQIGGPDASIRNCRFEGIGNAIETSPSYMASEYAQRMMVENCTFTNCKGPGVYSQVGDNHRIVGNHFKSCGSTGTTAPAKADVQFSTGTGHIVSGNIFEKSSNDYSIYLAAGVDKADVEIIGNTFSGFSTNGLGFGGGTAGDVTAAIAEYVAKNTTDISDVVTLGNADASPSVDGRKVIVTANEDPTTITGFDGGSIGQRVALQVMDVFTTLQHNSAGGAETPIVLVGGHDQKMSYGDVVEFLRISDDYWKEVATTPADYMKTATANDATPTVLGVRTLVTANSNPTTITNFDDGYNGQQLTLFINDANTTLDHNASATIVLASGSDETCSAGDVFEFVRFNGKWYEKTSTATT